MTETEDIMPTLRQKIKLNNEELMFFHKDVNSWRQKLRDRESEESTLEDLCYVLSSDDESTMDTEEDLVVEGNKCLRLGEWSRAISLYSSAILRKTNLPQSYTNRALGHLKRNNPADAEKDCTQAISLNPQYMTAYLRRACARKQLGKCKESCDDIEVVLKIDPDNKIALAEHEALIKYIQNDLLIEEKADDDKTREKTEMANKMKLQGNKLIENGDYTKAKEKFTAAIKLNQNDASYYANRAICHMKLMDFKSAEKDCDKALELQSDYIKLYIRRGRVRRKLGKMYEARQDFYNAYELSNDSKLLEELEEVDHLIRKSEENRRRKGMDVKELGVVSLVGSGKGSAVCQRNNLNWDKLRPKDDLMEDKTNETKKIESFQNNPSDSEAISTANHMDSIHTEQTSGNKYGTEPTRELPKGEDGNIKSKSTTVKQITNTADYNVREVFPLKPNDPTAKFSGSFIRIRVEDAMFALPETLFEIPEKFK